MSQLVRWPSSSEMSIVVLEAWRSLCGRFLIVRRVGDLTCAIKYRAMEDEDYCTIHYADNPQLAFAWCEKYFADNVQQGE